MSILLIIFWVNATTAFITGLTGHPFLCGASIVLAVLMAFMAIVYEGHLLNRMRKLEQEIENLKRRF